MNVCMCRLRLWKHTEHVAVDKIIVGFGLVMELDEGKKQTEYHRPYPERITPFSADCIKGKAKTKPVLVSIVQERGCVPVCVCTVV